jgi:hypothetical protein
MFLTIPLLNSYWPMLTYLGLTVLEKESVDVKYPRDLSFPQCSLKKFAITAGVCSNLAFLGPFLKSCTSLIDLIIKLIASAP